MVHAGCVFVASIHPSRTWTSGSFESVPWHACVHRLDLDLYSHLKKFGRNGVRTHGKKSPLLHKIVPRGGPNTHTNTHTHTHKHAHTHTHTRTRTRTCTHTHKHTCTHTCTHTQTHTHTYTHTLPPSFLSPCAAPTQTPHHACTLTIRRHKDTIQPQRHTHTTLQCSKTELQYSVHNVFVLNNWNAATHPSTSPTCVLSSSHFFHRNIAHKHQHFFFWAVDNFEDSGPEWYISSMLYTRDIPFWSRTLDLYIVYY